jgi:hypothetical protein
MNLNAWMDSILLFFCIFTLLKGIFLGREITRIWRELGYLLKVISFQTERINHLERKLGSRTDSMRKTNKQE